jgi:hypothetical protein
MPTGYTARIYEGEDQTFAEFAMNCARAFGYLIDLRDSPTAEIPEVFEPSSYYAENLDRAEAELWRWQQMSDEDVAADLRRAQQEAIKRREEIITTAAKLRERYESMLAKVQAWEIPSDEHVGLRDFMVQQLNDSIKHDCSTSFLPEPPPDDIDAWRESRISYAQRDVAYYAEQYAEECGRAEATTNWVRSLRKSLDSYGQ